MYRRLWGEFKPGNRFVSCRACVRSYARCGSPGDFTARSLCTPPFPFSLWAREPFPSPFWDHVFPFPWDKWDQGNPSEIKWVQVRSSESKWDQASPSEFKWDPPASAQSSYPALVGLIGIYIYRERERERERAREWNISFLIYIFIYINTYIYIYI